MSDFPFLSGSVIASTSTALASSVYGVKCLSGGANLKGIWQVLQTTTGHATTGLLWTIHKPTAAARFTVDFGIGPAGAERVVVPDLYFDSPRADQGGIHGYVPMSIPANSRLVVRTQASAAATGVFVSAWPMAGGAGQASNYRYQSVTAYGVSASTATTTATVIDAHGTANTKGQYRVLTAATTNPINGLIGIINGIANTAMTTCAWRMDLAIGPAGSEQIILGDFLISANTTDDDVAPDYFYLPVTIPKGARLAARSQCSITDATDQKFALALYGFA